MTFEEVIERFPGGRHTPRGEYEVKCPGHDDERASLGIKPGDNGGVVMKCQAGCPNDRIVSAVGLSLRDLMPPQANGHVRHGEQVYVYSDEEGTPLFEVVRTPEKQFWQRKPGARSGGVAGVRRVLFELPKLLQSEPGETVFIVEGEKDCWRLHKLGLRATTNAQGAGKWQQAYTDWLKEHLSDRKFIILPDNDEPGISHADAIEASLRGACLEVRSVLLPGLPAKGDVSDWLGGGKTKEELLEAVRPVPPRLFQKLLTFEQLLVQPPPVWLIEGLVYEETLFEVFSPPNEGKTFVVADLAMAIRRKVNWCGRQVHRSGPVLYVNADGGRGFSNRARDWVTIHGTPAAPHEFYTLQESINLYKPDAIKDLMEALDYMPEPPALAIFDTYSRCIPGVNENLQEFASLVVEHLTQMIRQFKCTIGLVHHTDLSGQHARGSSVILGACDTQIRVAKDADNVVTVSCEKQRDAAYFDPIYFDLGRIEGTEATWIMWRQQPPAVNQTDRKEAAIRQMRVAIQRDPGITREALMLGLDLTEPTCRRYVETLIVRGEVVETEIPAGEGQRGRHPRGLFIAP